MRETEGVDAKRYHHGDLRRALVEAAQRVLVAEGPSALSLRAVAREAGVSPAAPYHHFKDKSELLEAVANEGWRGLDEAVEVATEGVEIAEDRLTSFCVAYVEYARDNPAIYRVMYESARHREAVPYEAVIDRPNSAARRLRNTLIDAGIDPEDRIGLELAHVAIWSAAHGLAELAAFSSFDALKTALGGERNFLRGVFQHLGLAPGVGEH